MSWVPDFEIGLWNAWVLMLYYPLHPLIMFAIDKVVGTGEMTEKMGDAPYEPGERWKFMITMFVMLLMLLYSVFLPLKLGTLWFYTGLAIYLVGLVMFLTAIVNIAKTPLGQPFTKGMYRYSRHPMIFSSLITFVGISVAAASWIFLLLTIIVAVLNNSQAIAEERGCLQDYGDEYQDYMTRTSRWIGLPKSI